MLPDMPATPIHHEKTVTRPGLISALVVILGLSFFLGGGLGYAVARKDITVVAAGERVRHITFKRTVRDVLAETGTRLQADDEVAPAPDVRVVEGMSIVVHRAVPVTIQVDGKVVRVASAAPTVGDLLRRRGVVIGGADKVFPARTSPVWTGSRIRVVRIQHKLITEQLTIPYQVRSAQDPTTPRGIVRVREPGRQGLRERIIEVTLADGKAVRRDQVGQRVVRTPLDRVISIGTQVLVASRGEFAGKELLEMVATAYSPFCCRGVDDITAIGVRAGYGVVAVDPAIIPLGSRLYIEGYGYALAGDTGRAIKGLRIDLGFETKREALRFGRRPVRVYVIAKKEKKT